MESDTVGELEPQLVTIRAGAYEDEFYFATSLSLKQNQLFPTARFPDAAGWASFTSSSLGW